MASKEEESTEQTGNSCPPIKRNLIDPKSFNIRHFGQFSKEKFPRTYAGRGASEVNKVSKNPVINDANGRSATKGDNASAEKGNYSDLRNSTEEQPIDKENNAIGQSNTLEEKRKGEIQDTTLNGKRNVSESPGNGDTFEKQPSDQLAQPNSNEILSIVTHETNDSDQVRSNARSKEKYKISGDEERKNHLKEASLVTSENANIQKNHSNHTKDTEPNITDSDKNVFDDADKNPNHGHEDDSRAKMSSSHQIQLNKPNGIKDPKQEMTKLSHTVSMQECNHGDDSDTQQDDAAWNQLALDEPDMYILKFAFSCQTVWEKTKSRFHECGYEIQCEDYLLIRQYREETQLNENGIRNLMAECLEDLQSKIYTISSEISDDVIANVDHLKKRPITRMVPDNPFRDNAAEVFVTMSQNAGSCKLILVALKKCFRKCSKEIEEIIKGCMHWSDVSANNEPVYLNAKMNEWLNQNEEKEHYKCINVNCEEWKFKWFVKKEGSLDTIESKYNVQLHFYDGKMRIISETESQLEYFRVAFQKQTQSLVREIHNIKIILSENFGNSMGLNSQLRNFEQKYGVLLEIAKAVDYLEDIQIEIENVSVILTTCLKIETALVVNMTPTSNGFKFHITDEVAQQGSMKDAVKEMIQKCTDSLIVVQINRCLENVTGFARKLHDFIECLRESVKKNSEFTLLILTDKAKLYLRVQRMLERFMKPSVNRSPGLYERIDIQVIQGKLDEQKVGVIVNSSNESLTLTQGAVSRTLHDGFEMQKEANMNYPDGIRAGQIAETKGYGLHASYVLHTCLLGWNTFVKQKQDVCQRVLQNVVRKCLERTDQLELNSIAFPALGTGVHKIPDVIVAEDMIKTVQQYSKDNHNTCIHKVLFVIYVKEKQLFKVFMDKLNELATQETDLETHYDEKEYCAVITGKKENVSIAKDRFDEEFLSKYQSEISGHSQRMELQPKKQPDTYGFAIEGVTNPIYESILDKDSPFKDKASRVTAMNDEITIQDLRKGLTSEKGAIPKTNKAISEKKEMSDGSEICWKNEKAVKRNEEIQELPFEGDTSIDEVLDKYLQDVTVTLCQDQSKNLLEKKFELFRKRLKRECNVDLDVRGHFLKGTAKDIVMARLRIVNAFENQDAPSDLSGREVMGEETGSSDDYESDEDTIDNGLEQDIFERTLSLRTKTDEKFHLRNIRKEVFLLFKMIYKDKWQNISKYCKETCIDAMVYLSIGGTSENFFAIKNTLDKLDSFQFIELDSKIPFTQLSEKVNFIKEKEEKFSKVFIIDGGDTVFLVGGTYDLVDEIKRIVESTLMRENQTPRSKNRFGRQLSGFDKMDDDSYKSLSENKLQDENGHERKNIAERFDPSNIECCRKIFTNEGIKIFVYRSSILRLEVDCIVNAANCQLEHGGGIAKVIADAAGPRFVKECKDYIKSFGPLAVGTSCVTSAGHLPFKRVIHTVGPCMSDYRKDEIFKVEEALYNAIYSSLTELRKLGCTSIGMPSLSSGIFGVPKKICALQYCLAVRDFSQSQYKSSVKEVHFVDIDEEMIEIIGLTFEIVINNSDSSKEALKMIFPKQKTTTKAKVRKFLHLQKNKQSAEQQMNYPLVRSSFHSKLKIELSKGFQVSVRQGNIVDFQKGIVVCGQDPELKCQGGVARSILKVDRMFDGDLRRRHNKKRYNTGDVLEYRSKSLGRDIYNIVLPHGEVKFGIVSFCYSQVLEMASQKGVCAIALPLLITGNKEKVKQLGRLLAGLFIELVNAKGPHHVFPSVYIYNTGRHNVKMISEAFTEIILQAKADEDPNLQPSPGRWQRRSEFETSPGTKSRTSGTIDLDISGRYVLDAQIKPSCKGKNNILPEKHSDNPLLLLSKVEQMNKGIKDHLILSKDDDHDENIDNESMSRVTLEQKTEVGSLESMKCVICMDSLNEAKTLQKCGHTFCSDCIDAYFKVKPVCPTCFTPYGILTGTQPNGEMKYYNDRTMSLPGYKSCGLIKIQYIFPDGIQGEEHSNPGNPYTGTRRTAYLPDNEQGRKVRKMLEVAFKRRLVFTIGRSVTTGAENIVTWNDIHHKTNIYGGPAKYGFPDPDYLSRVREELAAKGVTEADIEF